MKILVCGDRHYRDVGRIRNELTSLFEYQAEAIIIEGGASGADSLGRQVGELLGMTIIEIGAEWDKYGRAAGPIRNKKMLELKPDLVLAFHKDIKNSKGTKNMIEQAKRAGVEVRLIED